MNYEREQLTKVGEDVYTPHIQFNRLKRFGVVVHEVVQLFMHRASFSEALVFGRGQARDHEVERMKPLKPIRAGPSKVGKFIEMAFDLKLLDLDVAEPLRLRIVRQGLDAAVRHLELADEVQGREKALRCASDVRDLVKPDHLQRLEMNGR